MAKEIAFEVRQETPTLDHYRRGWTPSPDVGLAGMWISAAVSDASGQHYFGLRGADDFIPGMTHTVTPICGFRPLRPTLDELPGHLYDEYAKHDWFEPLQYQDEGDKITLSFESGRFERDAKGLHWFDADGRWEIHGETVSDAVLTRVPAQEGLEREVYYRHELIKGHGVVNGVKVEGYVHQDYGYGPPGTIYSELPFLGQLQSMWVSWLHEHDDGSVGGGCFWQGRAGNPGFGPGYVLKDGVTIAHKHITTTPTFNANGRLSGLEIQAGDDAYTMAFTMAESPLHVLGEVTATSFGKAPKKSWCYAEYTGEMMSPEAVAWTLQRYRLARGR